MNVEATALFQYLATIAPEYRAKLLEVREEVRRWLAYVPQTFPHYTQHTIEHSEAIIAKVSKFLFHEDDPKRPTVKLSGVECYVLAAAAYLHDAGMVASDREKEDLLRSEEWKAWCAGEGGGAARWREIEAMRAVDPGDPLRNFAVDRQIRFLIAEFIRRNHHRRAASVISQHHAALGRLDYGDAMLRATIADVCVAHGLDRSDLRDRERYPERREVRGELVNVRFVAILLRIGDLLDMRHDRACSLLLTAACPLPADSYAHWTQYQRITHGLVAPDRIELRAECEQQEEHQFLYDWCSWLVDEVRSAAVLMANSARHSNWRPPVISLGDGTHGETITIRPSKAASYIPRKWHFEIDPTSVFQRLIRDVYDEQDAFLRELIQNAVDAMRCQMYADLQAQGGTCPEYPIDVPSEWLARYELRVSVETEIVRNQLSGSNEVRQVVVVDDCGIGMDQDIIERYFLQVGKSYYTSDSFRREFPFHPISRFGIGFLSVFAVSDHVTVDTLKVHGVAAPSAIRLTLSGPRSYLLVERSPRSSPGTRIAVRLKSPMPPGHLKEFVRNLCRRVEFPIRITEGNAEDVILAEGPDNYVCEVPDPMDANARLAMKAVPISDRGVRGELYVVVRISDGEESWAAGYLIYRYREQFPFATLPPSPEVQFCEHGLLRARGHNGIGWNFGAVLDDRRGQDRDVLDRSRLRSRGSAQDVLDRAWEAAIRCHLESSRLAKTDSGWHYIHSIASQLDGSWWPKIPGTIPVWVSGTMSRHSADEVASWESFTTICGTHKRNKEYDMIFPVSTEAKALASQIEGPVLLSEDIDSFAPALCEPLFAGRSAEIRVHTSDSFAIRWTRVQRGYVPGTCTYDDTSVLGILVHPRTNRGYGERYLLNVNHPLVAWTIEARARGVPGASKLWEHLCEAHRLDIAQHLLRQYRDEGVTPPPPATKISKSLYLTDFDSPKVGIRGTFHRPDTPRQ